MFLRVNYGCVQEGWVGGLAAGSVVSLPLVVVPRSGYVQCYMNTCSSARKMDGKFELCYAF